MPALAEYSNVYNSALLILERRGFQLWFDDTVELYCAEKDGWDFQATSPVGLLGLVTMWEEAAPDEYAEYWWRVSGEDLYRGLPKKPRHPYQPVWARRD